MAKEIKIKVSKAVLIKTETSENPLNMMADSSGTEEVHGRATASAAEPDDIHGRVITEVHGAGPHILDIHGRIQVPIPEGQTISKIEIERGEDGDLTIILHG